MSSGCAFRCSESKWRPGCEIRRSVSQPRKLPSAHGAAERGGKCYRRDSPMGKQVMTQRRGLTRLQQAGTLERTRPSCPRSDQAQIRSVLEACPKSWRMEAMKGKELTFLTKPEDGTYVLLMLDVSKEHTHTHTQLFPALFCLDICSFSNLI